MRGDRHTLLLTAGKLRRKFIGMCGKSHALQQFQCFFTSGCFIAFKHFHLRRGQVFNNRQMGNNSKCWNTIPTRERSFARSVFLSLTTMPSTVISPCCTGSRPLTVLISVDLPEPDGPQTTTTSPFSLRLSSRSAPESDHTILKHFSG